jgi:hypothetical protein
MFESLLVIHLVFWDYDIRDKLKNLRGVPKGATFLYTLKIACDER